MNKFVKAIIIASSCAISSVAVADGKTLYETRCASCHGIDAKSPVVPTYPKLAGQNAEYLESALKAYKANQRTNQQGMIMIGMAVALSDGEMKDISKYLSELPVQ